VAATWETGTAAGPRQALRVRSVQGATESAPTSDTEGFNLRGMRGFTMTIECDAGKVFGSAAGQLDLYHLDWGGDLPWSPVADREVTVPTSAIGLRRFTVIFEVVSSIGQIAYIANGLDVGGGGITITITSGER
jgi:hypothetical protein